MKKKQLISLVVAAVLFIAIGVSSVFSRTASDKMIEATLGETLTGDIEFMPPSEDYIAIVNVEGTIQEQVSADPFDIAEGYQHTTTMEYIDELMEDSSNKGILVYIDSPGGAVYESAELYDKIMEYKDVTDNPVYAYMGHMAASGGYMTSVACDYICANPNTITGSIGVIMSYVDVTGLYEKLGMRYISVTSGEFKDTSTMTDEQISEEFQGQIDETYLDFVKKVANGRDMSVEAVKKLADGRTYTANQALNNGLIDGIGSYEDLQAKMSEDCGTDVFYELESSLDPFALFFSEVKKCIPKSESQVLLEAAEDVESGVLMYYAGQ